MMAEPVISALSLHFAPLKIQKPRHNATGGNSGDRSGARSEKQFGVWRPLWWTLRGWTTIEICRGGRICSNCMAIAFFGGESGWALWSRSLETVVASYEADHGSPARSHS